VITQRLILIEPPEDVIGLDLIVKVWACAGCRVTFSHDENGRGTFLVHPDDCPELGPFIAAEAERICHPPYPAPKRAVS
jgi:hypothetical protein